MGTSLETVQFSLVLVGTSLETVQFSSVQFSSRRYLFGDSSGTSLETVQFSLVLVGTSLETVQFSLVLVGTSLETVQFSLRLSLYALGKSPCTVYTRLSEVALQTVPVLVWLTILLSRRIIERFLFLHISPPPFSTPLSPFSIPLSPFTTPLSSFYNTSLLLLQHLSPHPFSTPLSFFNTSHLLLLQRLSPPFSTPLSPFSTPLSPFSTPLSSKHIKGSKERLFIRTQTHTLQTVGVIPFVRLQNDT